MAIAKECYLIPVDVVEVTVRKLFKEDKNAALLYLLYYLSPDIVLKYGEEDWVQAGLETLKKWQLLEMLPESTKLYDHHIEGTMQAIDFVEELKKAQAMKNAIAASDGKVNAQILVDLFLERFLDMYGYPYKANITSKELGEMRNMIKQYGPDRAKYIVDKVDNFWSNYSKSTLSIEGLMKIAHSVPYTEKGVGEW